jgi:hypothetical protein
MIKFRYKRKENSSSSNNLNTSNPDLSQKKPPVNKNTRSFTLPKIISSSGKNDKTYQSCVNVIVVSVTLSFF